MKLAIMQPYIFPYIGYFQLIQAADKFVVYDDVAFIKQGWINRNAILVNGKSWMFTIPLDKPSSFVTIDNTYLNSKLYTSWANKFLRTLEQNYKKAPYYNEVHQMATEVLKPEESQITIAELATKSILATCNYLEINTQIVPTSASYENNNLSGTERIFDICKQENATQYVNAIGGRELYDKDAFSKNDLDLQFIKTKPIQYKQFTNEFVPYLSILDVLMFNSIAETKELLNQYELI